MVPIGREAGFATPVGDDLWVANPQEHSITVVDPRSGQVERTIDLDDEPRTIVVDRTGTVWVAAAQADSVIVIDPATGAVIDRVDVGHFTHGLTVVGSDVWVSNFLDGTLSVIDTTKRAVTATHPVGYRPGIGPYAFGSLWVTLFREGAMLRLDPTAPMLSSAAPYRDGRVAIGGNRSLYMRCSGEGTTTVLVEPGLYDDAGAWPIVEAMLAPRVRVCVYDRAGVERSEQGPRPTGCRGTRGRHPGGTRAHGRRDVWSWSATARVRPPRGTSPRPGTTSRAWCWSTRTTCHACRRLPSRTRQRPT